MLYKKFEGKKIYFAPIDNQNIGVNHKMDER